ncbi:MAG: sigma-70 family RNA polymerase sigma factor [Bacteroidia bacterium]
MNPTKALLNDCLDDNRKAHYDLYKLCFPFILGICRRYYRNKEDGMATLNMVFLKVIKNLSSYLKKDHIPFEVWVRRITINTIIDEFRKDSTYRKIIDQGSIEHFEENHSDERPELSIDTEEILLAVNQLPEMNRQVFNLYVIDGYKHDEIAGMLGISPSTSKVHLFKARRILRQMVDDFNKNSETVKRVLS